MKAAGALAIALLAACGRSRTGSPAATEPVQKLLGMTLKQTFHESPVWDMTAEEAVLADEESRAVVARPRMTFYKNGKAASKLTALSGTMGLKDRDVLLSSSVVVTSLDDESTLETEELRFLADRRKFFTDKDVRVKRPGARLRGSGLEATPDLSEIRVFNQRSIIEEGGVPR